ncbi:ORFS358W [Human betaherpesvirus 5]|nr:ORFS358W [Human betaherpesvirus 5]QHX40727.1 ORFS358W [Human betaherpesvirus 5]
MTVHRKEPKCHGVFFYLYSFPVLYS